MKGLQGVAVQLHLCIACAYDTCGVCSMQDVSVRRTVCCPLKDLSWVIMQARAFQKFRTAA